jgi:hypothetical protein
LPKERWEGIGFSAKIFGDAPALQDSMDGKKHSPHFYMGTPHMEMGRQAKQFPFGDSPFPYGVCDHLGINIHTDSLYLAAHPHHLGGDVQLGDDVQTNTCTVSFILFAF